MMDRSNASCFVRSAVQECGGDIEASLVKLRDTIAQLVEQEGEVSEEGNRLDIHVFRAPSEDSYAIVSVPDVFSTRTSVLTTDTEVETLEKKLASYARKGCLVRCRGMIQDIQPELTVLRASKEHFFDDPSDSHNRKDKDNEETQQGGEEREEEGAARSVCYVETAVLRVIPVPGNLSFYGEVESTGVGAAFDTPATNYFSRSGEMNACIDDAPLSTPSSLSAPTPSERNGRLAGAVVSLEDQGVDAQAATRKDQWRWRAMGRSKEVDTDVTGAMLPEELAMNLPAPISHPLLRSSCTVTLLAPKAYAKVSRVKTHSTEEEEESVDQRLSAIAHRPPFQMNDVFDFYGYLVEEEEEEKEKAAASEAREFSYGHNGLDCGDIEEEEDDPWGWGGDEWHPTEAYRKAGMRVSHLLAVAAVPLTTSNSFGSPAHLRQQEAHLLRTMQPPTPSSSGRPAQQSAGSTACQKEEGDGPRKREVVPCLPSLSRTQDTVWFEQHRAHAIHFLSTQLCGGDKLVAEYLLLHLCSHVLAHATATPLGDVPLLLRFDNRKDRTPDVAATPSAVDLPCETPSQKSSDRDESPPNREDAFSRLCQHWTQMLRKVAPVATILVSRSTVECAAASEEELNGAGVGRKRASATVRGVGRSFGPQYDTTGSYLKAGALQLANGTNLLINCQGMIPSPSSHRPNHTNAAAPTSTSAMDSYPMQNEKSAVYETLFSLVHQCRLPIEYPYHRVELPVSVSVLALAPVGETLPDVFQFPITLTLPVHYHKHRCVTESGRASVMGVECEWKSGDQTWGEELDGDAEKAAFPIPEHYTMADVRQYISAVRRQSTINFAHREKFLTEEVQQTLADALSSLGNDLEGWNNHHCLIHNHTFSAITSLIGVEAASRGKSSMTHNDIDHVISMERRRLRQNALIHDQH